MIETKQKLREYISADALANARKSAKPKFFGDEVWKYQLALRKLEYYESAEGLKRKFTMPLKLIARMKFHKYSVKLGFSIPVFAFDMGLSLPHYGTIVVAKKARIGKNCRIHEGVTIGATNGTDHAAHIGDNVFIGSGAKIIGGVKIADDVAIGANSVVTKDITEKGTTWAGAPARKISDENSHPNLSAIFKK